MGIKITALIIFLTACQWYIIWLVHATDKPIQTKKQAIMWLFPLVVPVIRFTGFFITGVIELIKDAISWFKNLE